MLQWVKHYFDTHYGGQPYNAKERREEARAQYKKGHKHAGTGLKRPVGAPAAAAEPAPKAAPAPKPAAPKAAPAAAAAPKAKVGAAKKPAAAAGGDDAAALTEQLSKLTLTIEGLEKERNFYFGKLREIEILSQDDEDAPADPSESAAEFKKKVLAVLYATDENAEFQVPEEGAAEEAAGDEGLLGEEELAE